jgi:hypothetical protein
MSRSPTIRRSAFDRWHRSNTNPEGMRTRPKLSASVPENHPPNDETSNATVPIRPASPRDSPHSAITVGMTKLYIWTSNASSAQPPKHAPIARRSRAVKSRAQASMAFLHEAISLDRRTPRTGTTTEIRWDQLCTCRWPRARKRSRGRQRRKLDRRTRFRFQEGPTRGIAGNQCQRHAAAIEVCPIQKRFSTRVAAPGRSHPASRQRAS